MEWSKNRLQYGLLLFLLAWSILAQAFISGYLVRSLAANAGAGRLPFQVTGDSMELSGSAAELRRMGLEQGDELIALNGHAISGFRELELHKYRYQPGDKVRVTAQRMMPNKQMHRVDAMVPIPPRRNELIDWLFTLVLHTFVPVFSLLLGFWVAFSRPHDPLAWLTLAMLASFGQLAPGNFYGLDPPWMQLVISYRSLLSNTWPLWIMLFGLFFPKPFPFLRKNGRWISWLLAIPFAVLTLVDFYTDFYDGTHIAVIRSFARFEKHWETPLLIFFICCVGSFLISIALKVKRSREPDARRRLQWLLTGSAVSLGPPLLVEIAHGLLQVDLPFWLMATSIFMVALFPVVLAYLIVVQRAMQVRVALRIGVQYALARGGVQVARALLSACVVILAFNLASHSTGPVTGAILISLTVLLISILGRIGKRIALWIDRKFFREAYNTEVVLTELSQNVAVIRDTRALLETVSRQISDTLHVPRVAVLLSTSGAFRPAYSLGFSQLPPIELKCEATTIRELQEAGEPSKVFLEDETSWVQRTPDEEREILRMLDTQLLLPLALKERLLGIISLGPKLSEEPYSPSDLRLLHAVASQTGLALENARLTESIKREVAQRERINRELEIAREVQQRLFPQELRPIGGLDYCGYCRPQQNVGGDYYDFVYLPESNLGIAIGDVSGKGIAASLMMAALQALLRGQTIRPLERPCDIVQAINKLAFDASAPNRYATFFYGQYDPAKRLLVYVNAGHNAPIVYRPKAGRPETIRLEEGGTVLGLFADVQYQQACVPLQPGDVLVAYTDGISEAMDANEEEWDEGRLIAAIEECCTEQSRSVIDHILERVDAFTAGAAQHDDMTLVVARVL